MLAEIRGRSQITIPSEIIKSSVFRRAINSTLWKGTAVYSFALSLSTRKTKLQKSQNTERVGK